MSSSAESKPVSATRTSFAQVMTPEHANILGNVFGGTVLSLIDLTAYATASKFAGNVCVTASFDQVDFHEPIHVGEIVNLEGVVSFVGRTSVEVTIDVFATDVLSGEQRKTNTARVTMVALKDGRPVAVPRLICETKEDKVRFLSGKFRRAVRDANRTRVADQLAELDSMKEPELDGLIAES